MSEGMSREEILALLKSEISVSVETSSDYEGDRVFLRVRVAVSFAGEEVASDSDSISVG